MIKSGHVAAKERDLVTLFRRDVDCLGDILRVEPEELRHSRPGIAAKQIPRDLRIGHMPHIVPGQRRRRKKQVH